MSELSILEKLDAIERLIREERISDKWVGMREASKYVGLSEATLRRAVQSGRLKCSKQTGKVLFRVGWLDKFLIFGKLRLNAKERREFEREFGQ